MRVAIIYDGPSSTGATPDLLILETVAAVERAMQARGDDVLRIAVYGGSEWISELERAKVDLVFNLCEGIDGIAEAEPAVIGVLELLSIPYTGASAWTTAVCLRKHVVNAALEQAGLPIPRWALATRGGGMPDVGFPAICKPAAEDASIGVEQRSVVRNHDELRTRLALMHERWRDVLVQRFVDGREMNVGIIGDHTLPVSEIVFDDMPPGFWRIVSYRAKWDTGSEEDRGTQPRCPAEIPASLASRLQALSAEAWRCVGGSGFARVDFRVDGDQPWILEVNANPDISPDAGLARMARAAGRRYEELVWMVCDEAMQQPRPGMTAWTRAIRLRDAGLTATAELA